MKAPAFVLAALASMLVAVPASSQGGSEVRTALTAGPPASAFLPAGAFGPRQTVFFGYVRSLTRSGGRYVARVDPALVLSGITATRAAVEDKVIPPGGFVPNDFYNLNESKRTYAYRVPANAHVTVLDNPGTGPRSVVIPVPGSRRSSEARIPRGVRGSGDPRPASGSGRQGIGRWRSIRPTGRSELVPPLSPEGCPGVAHSMSA